VTSSDLKVRSVDGTGAMTKWTIGETSSGSRSGAGVVDLNGGSLDAVVTELLVGRHIAAANNGSTSSLNMGGGSLLATTMVLGEKSSTGTPTLTSTMTQTGGEAKIGTLIFGKDAGTGATANFISTYNLSATGASLAAQDINAGTGGYGSGSVRKINFGAGTIRNYDANTDLTISGRDTTASGRLEIAVASNANSRTFFADANRKITVQDTAVLTYQGSITKDGAGTLDLRGANSYQGGTLVTSGTLLANNLISGTNSATGSGAVTVASGGSLGGSGYIAGATTISGTLRPGNSPGVLTFGSDLTLNTGGNMIWELWANTEVNSPVTYDQTVVGGNLNVAGSFGITLDFGTLAGGSAVSWADTFWATQRSWVLFDVAGTTSGASNLTLLNAAYNDANGASLATARGGASFSIAQVGSDVVVNYIPEPSSSSLILIGLGALTAVRSFRRRS
jgi:autotransporter-associated beta strand protein